MILGAKDTYPNGWKCWQDKEENLRPRGAIVDFRPQSTSKTVETSCHHYCYHKLPISRTQEVIIIITGRLSVYYRVIPQKSLGNSPRLRLYCFNLGNRFRAKYFLYLQFNSSPHSATQSNLLGVITKLSQKKLCSSFQECLYVSREMKRYNC